MGVSPILRLKSEMKCVSLILKVSNFPCINDINNSFLISHI